MTIDEWLAQTKQTLIKGWGLDKSFADLAALFLGYLFMYNLSPRITSGWRSPQKQADLLSRYEAGDPSIVYKPATNSKHMVTKWGQPASLAIDITTSNPALAADIATAIGMKAGYHFRTPDPVHFYA